MLVDVGIGLHEGFERRQFAPVGLCLALICPLLPGVGCAFSFVGCAFSFVGCAFSFVGCTISLVGCTISLVQYCVLVFLAAVKPSLTFIEFRGPSYVAGLALRSVEVSAFS